MIALKYWKLAFPVCMKFWKNYSFCDREIYCEAWWLSWLERRPVTAEVVGSNPIRVAHIFMNVYMALIEYIVQNGILAQLGEHLPYKQRVTGSSPVGPIYPMDNAGVAELADAQDLKSCGTNLPYRFDSGRRHWILTSKTLKNQGFRGFCLF